MASRNPGKGLSPLERTMEVGIMMGMAAAVPMAAVAMTAAATEGAGFYTPMYRIAAILDPLPLLASLEDGAAGDPFHLEVQPALAGLAVHLALGAGFGVAFAFLARRLGLRGPAALGVAGAYGLAVAALMGLAVLPLVGEALSGAPAVGELTAAVGWPSFTLQHLVFGLALGAWAALRPQDLNTLRQGQQTLESDTTAE